jgi:mRNA-degrading endonuclease RelE of RelBE toxin-antitoxin system
MKAIHWTSKSIRQVKKIKSVAVRREIVEKVEALQGWPDVSSVKNLVNREGYRLRVGDWRIVFSVEGDEVVIWEVRRRNEQTY